MLQESLCYTNNTCYAFLLCSTITQKELKENLLRYLNYDSPANAEFFGQDLYARMYIPSGVEVTLDCEG